MPSGVHFVLLFLTHVDPEVHMKPICKLIGDTAMDCAIRAMGFEEQVFRFIRGLWDLAAPLPLQSPSLIYTRR